MSYSAFEKAFQRTAIHEGGYSCDPHDRGNWTSGKVGRGELRGTNCGISAMSYPDLDIERLTISQIRAVYWRDWWQPLGLERFPRALHFQMFDAAINHGAHGAAKILQMALKVKADGIIGPVTVSATQKLSVDDLLMRFIAARLVYMTKIRTWDRYGRGWARRIAKNLIHATEDN